MKNHALALGFGAVLLLGVVASADAQVIVTVDRNTGAAATHAFKFPRVPSPVAGDAAAKAKLVLVDGTRDDNGGGLDGLTDGLLPHEEDEPGANFFFDAGTAGGRFMMDLTTTVEISQVNTYSWHPNTRGPQIYTLYASDGSDPKFNPAPKAGVDPTTCGWKRVTAVDTRPQGDEGGQYGVSITEKSGSLGTFRYLLFDCAVTETDDDYGNTFYSEIDVIARGGSGQATEVRGLMSRTSNFWLHTSNFRRRISAACVSQSIHVRRDRSHL
jgi:hypothetical protein